MGLFGKQCVLTKQMANYKLQYKNSKPSKFNIDVKEYTKYIFTTSYEKKD